MVRLSRKQKKLLQPRSRKPLQTNYERPSVFSYRASRVEKDRQFDRGTSLASDMAASSFVKRLRQVPFVLSLLAIFIAVLYSLSLSNHAQLVVNGDQSLLRGKQLYQQGIDDILSSSIQNRTKVTLKSASVSDQIRNAFPELASVSVSTPLLRHKPVVEVRLAKPATLLVTTPATYVLDGQGKALFNIKDKAASLKTTDLPVITDSSNHEVSLGKPALTADQVSYIRQLYLQSAAKQLTIESMTLQAGGGELQVRYSGLNYFVKFNFAADPRQSIGAFFAVKERLTGENRPIAEYIDVRIPDRAFVK
jgi:hypothetical protein